MIRKFKTYDLETIMAIWLSSNLQAHHFIPASYWKNNVEMVKEILPQAEVYVYEEENQILGFVGIDQGYIAGIFVLDSMRSRGIGKALLDKAKSLYTTLSLSVYEKNKGAVSFYQREGFQIDKTQVDEQTGETEYFMIW